jgi:hypothetical protein
MKKVEYVHSYLIDLLTDNRATIDGKGGVVAGGLPHDVEESMMVGLLTSLTSIIIHHYSIYLSIYLSLVICYWCL